MDRLEGALDGLDVSDIQTMIADKPGKMLDIIKLIDVYKRQPLICVLLHDGIQPWAGHVS